MAAFLSGACDSKVVAAIWTSVPWPYACDARGSAAAGHAKGPALAGPLGRRARDRGTAPEAGAGLGGRRQDRRFHHQRPGRNGRGHGCLPRPRPAAAGAVCVKRNGESLYTNPFVSPAGDTSGAGGSPPSVHGSASLCRRHRTSRRPGRSPKGPSGRGPGRACSRRRGISLITGRAPPMLVFISCLRRAGSFPRRGD